MCSELLLTIFARRRSNADWACGLDSTLLTSSSSLSLSVPTDSAMVSMGEGSTEPSLEHWLRATRADGLKDDSSRRLLVPLLLLLLRPPSPPRPAVTSRRGLAGRRLASFSRLARSTASWVLRSSSSPLWLLVVRWMLLSRSPLPPWLLL